jgi:FAD:protein FMN transferase
MTDITFRAMGSHIQVFLDRADHFAERCLADVPDWFAAWEKTLSRFRLDSELSLLNSQAGLSTPVSETLWQVLQAAYHGAVQSDGLVSPLIGAALVAAGYDRSFPLLAAAQTALPMVARPIPEYSMLTFDHADHAVTVPDGAQLDLGGIAKGWAATETLKRLGDYGPVLVDAGGDITTSGPRADGSPWPVGVADPLGNEQPLDILLLVGESVATSGRDYRTWRQGTALRHHLIDPRTGLPAFTDVLTATVVAPDMLEAEVAAKMALLLGSVEGQAWLATHTQYAWLLVCEDGRVLRSANWLRYAWGNSITALVP